MNEPSEDQDAAGGPTHQPSVQPGMAHLPVRGQPTIFSGERVQVLPRVAESRLIVELPAPHAPQGTWMLRRSLQ